MWSFYWLTLSYSQIISIFFIENPSFNPFISQNFTSYVSGLGQVFSIEVCLGLVGQAVWWRIFHWDLSSFQTHVCFPKDNFKQLISIWRWRGGHVRLPHDDLEPQLIQADNYPGVAFNVPDHVVELNSQLENIPQTGLTEGKNRSSIFTANCVIKSWLYASQISTNDPKYNFLI